jgi:hypothetical protein
MMYNVAPAQAPPQVGWDNAQALSAARPTSVRQDSGVVCWWEDSSTVGLQEGFETTAAKPVVSLEMKQETVITNREEITRAKEQTREAAQTRVLCSYHSRLIYLF